MVKRIYSLNKASYLIAQGLEPVEVDIDSDNGAVFFVFENSPKTAESIKKFYADVGLHAFISSFSRVIKTIKAKKAEIKNR